MSYCTPQGIYAFVIEKDGVADSDEEVIQHLKQLIRKQIGGFAVPEAFLVRLYHNNYIDFLPRGGCLMIEIFAFTSRIPDCWLTRLNMPGNTSIVCIHLSV